MATRSDRKVPVMGYPTMPATSPEANAAALINAARLVSGGEDGKLIIDLIMQLEQGEAWDLLIVLAGIAHQAMSVISEEQGWDYQKTLAELLSGLDESMGSRD